MLASLLKLQDQFEIYYGVSDPGMFLWKVCDLDADQNSTMTAAGGHIFFTEDD